MGDSILAQHIADCNKFNIPLKRVTKNKFSRSVPLPSFYFYPTIAIKNINPPFEEQRL